MFSNMRCGILLVTHPGLGNALLEVVRHLFGPVPLPLHCQCLEVGYDADPASLLPAALQTLQDLDGGAGVLLLTDLYGASPSNLASDLHALHRHCRRVSGLNLPMLVRVMNYPDLALDGLTQIAASAPEHGAIVDNA